MELSTSVHTDHCQVQMPAAIHSYPHSVSGLDWPADGSLFYEQSGCWTSPRLRKLLNLPADSLEKIKLRWVSLTGSSFQIWLGYRSQMKPWDSFCLCVAVRAAVARQHRATAENNVHTMRSLYIEGYCVGIAIEFWTLCFCLGQPVCRRWRDDGWISVCFIRTILQPLAASTGRKPFST